ncbi:MAG: bis(5'-nucleosyl)-tetraphosphatase (symmetrical) YqeK [Eubacterium sp.]|nr:bis(5'-nucleosyl)-tetraphosphatase (symmetrical) YqeK [Eubacterium sp.]
MSKLTEYKEKYKEYEQLLKDTLSKKRLTHSLNVAEQCLRLAERHGGDTEKAYLAGLLHDIKKEETPQAMKSQAALSEMDVSEEELYTPALWHAPAGAYHIRTKLGITDADLLNAVRYHTAGRADMTVLEKIVYLGDMTSEDRSYKDVEKFRRVCMDDLDEAMYDALKFSIQETLGKHGLIPPCTAGAYNFYAALHNERKKNK